MKKIVLTGLFVLLATALLSSCAVVGKDFPTDKVSMIKIDQSTKADINSLFGTPWRTGVEDGDKTWTYGYYKYTLFGSSVTRDLIVRFNEAGTVTSYSFNTSDFEE